MSKIERTDSGRIKTVTLHNPKAFIRDLHKSFRRCQRMEQRGDPRAAIGWAFYSSMCELFGDVAEQEPNPQYPIALPAKRSK